MTAPNAKSCLRPDPFLLTQEIRNRYLQLPAEQQADPFVALVRIVAELAIEMESP
jgi:hypothetical protein